MKRHRVSRPAVRDALWAIGRPATAREVAEKVPGASGPQVATALRDLEDVGEVRSGYDGRRLTYDAVAPPQGREDPIDELLLGVIRLMPRSTSAEIGAAMREVEVPLGTPLLRQRLNALNEAGLLARSVSDRNGTPYVWWVPDE